MRALSRSQKIRVLILVFVVFLLFFAVGIVTDFFANPAFSIFFVLSHEEAHRFGLFLAAGVGAGAIMAVIITVVRIKGSRKV